MELLSTAAAEGGGEKQRLWHIVTFSSYNCRLYSSPKLTAVAVVQYKLHKNVAPWASLGKDLHTINGQWKKSMSCHEAGIEIQQEKII